MLILITLITRNQYDSHVGKPSFVERDICLQLKNTIRYLRRTKDSNNGILYSYITIIH